MSEITPDYTLLGLLSIHPCHGYELLDSFRQPNQLGRVWHMSTSQLYNVLKRLEANGWITGSALASDTAPTRMEYRLTDEGTRALHNWLREPTPSPSIRRVRVEFLSRLFIARELNLPTGGIIQCQRNACEAERDRLLHARGNAAPGFDYLTIEFQVAQLNAVLDWIARCALVSDADTLEDTQA